MRKLWAEFKAIAIGGTVLDLALGFIIGSAFAALIQSFVTNLFLQAVASLVGAPDFKNMHLDIRRTPIRYGVFLNDLLQFLLLAVALFVVIKLMTVIGLERAGSLDQRPCPFCYDRIPAAALTCRSCGQHLVAELPSVAEAERILAEREARRWPAITIPRRRPTASADASPGGHSPASATVEAPEPAPARDE